MGRPLTQGPRPTCPQGHLGHVVSFGSRIRPDGLFAKSRYRCVPPIGVAAAHVFTHGCTDGEDPKGHKADRLPELLCDWDPSNEHDPAQLTYGMDVAIKWICAV